MLDAEKELGKVQSGVANVTQVMKRLDKATPNELRKSLKQLKNDLDNLERGSRAWDEHQRKIKAVKAELAKINAESKVQLSLWGRFAKKMFEWGTAIQTVMATITGVTLTIRQSVKAFAEMDQEMANVRKYTGMTADEVERLNDEFKKIDTRSSREKLNQLAQEAGRLGMQSQEDVMGFVRAADKINVALDELGEGATLTLSKLTTIFGDRDRLGVEKSLLSVGSVINELSQNCTASAPYIAEFASRLAGVGANAGMTTQQIMGYAAVMDSYGQKVESSATALSQVIVRLYRDPAKYAKVAGLDVKNFTDLLKKDVNAALIQLLETLNKVGGMDVLSPMFADMGENGARAIQALSTMAKHIDEVKAQQEVANQAFEEAISIDKEFNVQNNTVQAGLEKAKKHFNEMAVTLGEKLAPMMKYTITSSAAMMKAIAGTVEFLGDHKKAVLNTTIALTAFTIAVNASTLATKLHALGVKMAATASASWNGILRIGTAIQKTFTAAVGYGHVVVTLFTKGTTAARIEFAALNATIKANPFGLLLTVLTAVILAIVNLKGKTDEYTKAANENIKAAKGLNAEYYKEQRELDILFGKLEAAKKGTKEYESAKKAIINQYGQYLSGLIDEKGEVINLTEAYNRLAFAIRRSAQERGIAAAREKNTQDYYSTLSEDLKELQTSLEKVGVPVREAASIVQKVSDAATSGKSLDKKTSDWIRAYSSRDGWNNVFSPGKTPWGIANRIFNRNDEYNKAERSFDAMEQAVAPFKNIPIGRLTNSLEQLEKIIKTGKSGHALVVVGGNSPDEFREVTVNEAKTLVEGLRQEIAYKKGQDGYPSSNSPTSTSGGGSYAHHETEKERKARLAEEKKRQAEEAKQARIAAALEKKEFKDAMDQAEANWTTKRTESLKEYREGLLDYEQYLKNLHQAADEYYETALAVHKKHGTEESDAAKKLNEAREKEQQDHEKRMLQIRLDRYADDRDAAKTAAQMAFYDPDNSEAYHNQRLLDKKRAKADIDYLEARLKEYEQGTKEYYEAEKALDKACKEWEVQRRKQLEEDLMTWSIAYQRQSAEKKMAIELAVIDELVRLDKMKTEEAEKVKAQIRKKYRDQQVSEVDSATGTKAPGADMDKLGEDRDRALEALESYKGTMSEEEYQSRRHQIIKNYHDKVIELVRSEGSEWATMLTTLVEKWKTAMDDLNPKNIADVAEAAFAIMNVGLQMYMEQAAAARDLEVAKAEKSYERQISMAEGNAYKTKQLEKKKQKEVAKIKNEYNKRAQTIEIAQAIASTALAAVNAFASAAKVAWWLGPVAAALATATGLAQVATIKKQHEAEAAGYSKGGFTPAGRVDEPVGVVHAGEWVASQKLVKNPQTRPLIEALDFAQRNNTIGRLTSSDVSRTVTAPSMIAGAAGDGSMQRTMEAMVVVMSRYDETMSRLGDRLDEPFVTVNTVTGDTGIKRAQDEYQKLMNNTLPKNKRK